MSRSHTRRRTWYQRLADWILGRKWFYGVDVESGYGAVTITGYRARNGVIYVTEEHFEKEPTHDRP